MPTVACSTCSATMDVDQRQAGQSISCSGCGAKVAVPASQQPMTVAPLDASDIPTHPPDGNPDQTIISPTTAQPDDEDREEITRKLAGLLAPPQSSDEIGRLGAFRVLGIIGHGGMGVVYQAEDVKLKRKIALKAMLPSVSGGKSAAQRFLSEAEAMAKVEHPHVARIYQVDEDRGIPFFAMEFLRGETLDSRLDREGKLPVMDVLRIGREIADGLAAAHETGLIHRDIKPANIWLEHPKGFVKILDFGLARPESGSKNLTKSGVIVGTPAYMAPEQARAGKIDARTDLFSLGIVLYRMCTGELPFRGADTVSTLMAVAADTPLPPQAVNFDVPGALDTLIMKLLAKPPAERCQSALEVSDALAAIEREQFNLRKALQESAERKATTSAPPSAASPWVAGWTEAMKEKADSDGNVTPLMTPVSAPNRTGMWLAAGGVAILIVGALVVWKIVS